MSLIDNYQHYLAETGSEVAAAILAIGAGNQTTPEPAAILTPAEIAERLHASHDTVLGWINCGQLKASNLASGTRPRYVITPDDLAAFLKKRQPMPPEPRQRRRPASSKPKRY